MAGLRSLIGQHIMEIRIGRYIVKAVFDSGDVLSIHSDFYVLPEDDAQISAYNVQKCTGEIHFSKILENMIADVFLVENKCEIVFESGVRLYIDRLKNSGENGTVNINGEVVVF